MFKEVLLTMHTMVAIITLHIIIWMMIVVKNKKLNPLALRKLSVIVLAGMVVTWVVAGYWYVVFYGDDKQVIIKSSWNLAHKFFMETKEHIFFISLILAFYLPFVTFLNDLKENEMAKKLIFSILSILLILTLYIDLAGVIIAKGAKEGYIQQLTKEKIDATK